MNQYDRLNLSGCRIIQFQIDKNGNHIEVGEFPKEITDKLNHNEILELACNYRLKGKND